MGFGPADRADTAGPGRAGAGDGIPCRLRPRPAGRARTPGDRVANAWPRGVAGAAVAARASAAELAPVIDVFRDPACSFLMPPAGTPLRPDSPIDISHESLMRVWDRLRTWGDEEAQSAQTYRRLAEIAELNRAGSAGLLRQPDLQCAVNWQRRQQPNAAWAARYRPGFDATTEFLAKSAQAYQDKRRKDEGRARQWRWLAVSLIGGLAAVAAVPLHRVAAGNFRGAGAARAGKQRCAVGHRANQCAVLSDANRSTRLGFGTGSRRTRGRRVHPLACRPADCGRTRPSCSSAGSGAGG